IADGLTKSLPKLSHLAFLQRLKITDQKEILKANRNRELSEDQAKLEALMMKEDLWNYPE
ncbi:uncharacterized protein BKA55DRAFT_528076, partial [Fusarium redolens]